MESISTERIYWAAEQVERKAGDIDELHLDENNYYLKSEADKVIAEKDAEIERLKAIRKVHVKAIESMGAGLQQDEEEIRHHKYKRCMAMAKWCESEANYWYDTTLVQQRWHYGFYVSWCEKWLKLADQFSDKEA